MRDHARAPAVRHDAAGIRHIRTVSERRVRGDRLFGVLFRRDGLARERRFLYFEGRGGEQPHIRGHDVARFEFDYVARHDFLARKVLPFAVAQHLREGFVHIFEGFHSRFGLVFLHNADYRVDDDDEQNDAGVDELAVFLLNKGDDRRHYRGNDKHDNHNVLELFEEFAQQTLLLRFLQGVLAVLRDALVRLCRGQPLFRRRKRTQDFFGRFVVERAARFRGGFRRGDSFDIRFHVVGFVLKGFHIFSFYLPPRLAAAVAPLFGRVRTRAHARHIIMSRNGAFSRTRL